MRAVSIAVETLDGPEDIDCTISTSDLRRVQAKLEKLELVGAIMSWRIDDWPPRMTYQEVAERLDGMTDG